MISSVLSRHFDPLVSKRVNITALILLILQALYSDVQGEITVKNKFNSTVAVFFDIQLGYSSTIPADGVLGKLVTSEPEDGCSPIKSPPNRTDPNILWFVLVRRFPCSFRIKINNAVTAGYDGIIIYNAEVPPKNVTYSHGNTSHYIAFGSDGIPAVLISNEDGTTLKSLYLYEKNYFILITPEFEQNMLTYLLPFAVIVGICLLFLVIFRIMKCLRDQQNQRRSRLPSKLLKKLTITKYHKGDHYDTCSVCLEDYVEGEKVRELPCGHIYHLKCIDPWLTRNKRVCPVCKAKVRLPGVPESSESEAENTNPNERTPLVEPQRNRSSGRTRSTSSRQSRSRGSNGDRSNRVRAGAGASRSVNSTLSNYQAAIDSFFDFSTPPRSISPIIERARTAPADATTSRPSNRLPGRRHRRQRSNNNSTNQEGNIRQESHQELTQDDRAPLLMFDPAEPSTSYSHQDNERQRDQEGHRHHEATTTTETTTPIIHGHESSVEAVIEVEPHAICDHQEHTTHTIDV